MSNSPGIMPLDLFRKIITKAKAEGYEVFGPYSWTEPFLNNRLPEYLRMAKELGFTCWLSSNLSFQDKQEIIKQSLPYLDLFVVSVSGSTQKIYEINHKGGRLDFVKANLEFISSLPHNKVVLRLIKFDYNAQEEAPLRNYAESLGLDFESITGAWHPYNNLDFYIESVYLDLLKAPEKHYEGICYFISEHISLDFKGDIYPCCHVPYYPALKIGNYLNMTPERILKNRFNHPICNSCENRMTKSINITPSQINTINAPEVTLLHRILKSRYIQQASRFFR